MQRGQNPPFINITPLMVTHQILEFFKPPNFTASQPLSDCVQIHHFHLHRYACIYLPWLTNKHLQQEVGDDLRVCMMNFLPKVSSLCDLMWPDVHHLIKGSYLGACYTKLALLLVWCRYIFCRWRYVFDLSSDPTRPLCWDTPCSMPPPWNVWWS